MAVVYLHSLLLQIAVGHEGVHAIMVLDSGVALFTGVARRGEDGDNSKHRRTPKPTRPKKMLKVRCSAIYCLRCPIKTSCVFWRQIRIR